MTLPLNGLVLEPRIFYLFFDKTTKEQTREKMINYRKLLEYRNKAKEVIFYILGSDLLLVVYSLGV